MRIIDKKEMDFFTDLGAGWISAFVNETVDGKPTIVLADCELYLLEVGETLPDSLKNLIENDEKIEKQNTEWMKNIVLINRQWAMPSSDTFTIKELINKYIHGITVDPFARNSKICKITNDIDPETTSEYHLDAIDFLKTLSNESIDFLLYDPPYSPRQVSECYKKVGKSVDMKTTQSSYWSNQKKEISRVIKPKGIVISFGWNSGGIGKKYGFEIIEILLVNDTICTVEQKV